ncbi:MAG: pantoate--beta-alanine ligase [Filimonas sp.]|nr:pantoate--beta-alanine ligase [Filimonas sp.]
MILFKQITDIQHYIEKLHREGKTVGFVPTMGALHNGHISLIDLSKKNTDVTVCSIFVNPTQFNDPKDFEKYPVTIDNDILLLEQAGTDILFLPSVKEMYPGGMELQKPYDLGFVETVLEGAYRPGHFQGVCQVVHRLLDIVKPDKLFMGQKDYQQCMVIKKLIELTGIKTTLVIAPTQREPEGLALSSRNMRLSTDEKEEALAIYQTLKHIKNNFTTTSFTNLAAFATDFLHKEGFSRVDYVAIADAETLAPTDNYMPDKKYVALVAAFKGEVRLIDNMLLN